MSRLGFAAALLVGILYAGSGIAAGPSDGAPSGFSLTGKVKHPQQIGIEALQSLPPERVEVSFQTDRGPAQAGFTGARLWALLDMVGGIDDADKSAPLHHMLRITGRDGYWVLLSTGEIAPDFGGKAALVAYQRDGAPLGAAGLRLVMPGDIHGGRNVRDLVSIEVE